MKDNLGKHTEFDSGIWTLISFSNLFDSPVDSFGMLYGSSIVGCKNIHLLLVLCTHIHISKKSLQGVFLTTSE